MWWFIAIMKDTVLSLKTVFCVLFITEKFETDALLYLCTVEDLSQLCVAKYMILENVQNKTLFIL